VRSDAGSLAAYSTDASNFRQVPIGVVVPRAPEAAIEAVAVCRRHRVPMLSRGGRKSLAGHEHRSGAGLVEVLQPRRAR
jgi:FAD/FMN-containing dehydrogenase